MGEQLRSAQEARRWFYEAGVSMTDWAREYGFPRQAVYAVLSGRSRCVRGRGHRIAVALGMKRSADATQHHSPSTIRRQHEGNEVESRSATVRGVGADQVIASVPTTEEASP